jgi:hypothetical protein
LCPITRNEPDKGEVRISDIANFGEVLDAIYVIRCNLIHGEKSPDDERDTNLAQRAFRTLSKAFGVIVEKIDPIGWS